MYNLAQDLLLALERSKPCSYCHQGAKGTLMVAEETSDER